ncbi:MAG: hypothetical protein WCP57_09435 [Bacteroidota bacterium]
MKKFKTSLFLLIFTVISTSSLFAQSLSDYIDVVYLTNGSMIKGIIIEQVPGKSLKIQTNDGSQFSYQISEVEKFTRELKPMPAPTAVTTPTTKIKKEPKPFYSKQKGYFGGVELLMEGSPGLRVLNGYKFGRFGYLGLAVGIEANKIGNYNDGRLMDDYMGGRPYRSGYNYHSPFVSFNIVYGGDILKRKVTPFYQIELGYGLNLNNRSDRFYSYYDYNTNSTYEYNYQQKNIGGPMGGALFGVKFYTNKKVNFKLGLSARWFTNIYDPINYPIQTFAPVYNNGSGVDMNASAGLRFGIGF